MQFGFVTAILVATVALSGCLSDESGMDAELNGASSESLSALTFRDPVYLECPDHPTYGNYPTGDSGQCAGFGEPTLEVAGDGAIWYSSVCCVGQSPPIWVSRDGGETFDALPFADGTGALRDGAGIEGDFGIDDAGNVYFFDITLATVYFTKYAADGEHIHTTPVSFGNAVDRPWVRGGVEDEVWIFYNALLETVLHHSTDGGMTWDVFGGTSFPCGLMTFGQGPERDDLVVSGCPDDPAAWISSDGGVSFTDRIDLPFGEKGTFQEDQTVTEQYMQPSMDAAGYSYIPVTHTLGSDPNDADASIHTATSVYIISPEGDVSGPFLATSPDGLADKPWSIAGKDGVFAMAYYGADDVDREFEADEAQWDLKVTYTLNGQGAEPSWHTVVAHEGVLDGTFGRQLGDFLEIRQTPDGGLAIAYASRQTPESSLVNWFIRTEMAPDFGPEVFRNGPPT